MKVSQVFLLSLGVLGALRTSAQAELNVPAYYFEGAESDYPEANYDDDFDAEFDDEEESRNPQAQLMTAQEFQSDKAVEVNRPSAAFQALIQKENPLLVQAFEEDDKEFEDESFESADDEAYEPEEENYNDSIFESSREEAFDSESLQDPISEQALETLETESFEVENMDNESFEQFYTAFEHDFAALSDAIDEEFDNQPDSDFDDATVEEEKDEGDLKAAKSSKASTSSENETSSSANSTLPFLGTTGNSII
jgi:hypothetical protein